MDNRQAAALVIENIGMLEEAKRLLEGEVSRKVFAAIDQLVEAWVEEKGWSGYFNLFEDEQYFGAREWIREAKSGEAYVAWFALAHNDTEEEWWLTSVLGSRSSLAGFRFHIDPNKGRRVWKIFASQKNQEYPEIEEAGFQFEPVDGTWFLPWKLDARQLAENYARDSIARALDPVRDALHKIEALQPVFVKLVDAAQQQLGAVQDAESRLAEA